MNIDELVVTLKMLDINYNLSIDKLNIIIYLEHKPEYKNLIINLLDENKYQCFITCYNNICVSLKK